MQCKKINEKHNEDPTDNYLDTFCGDSGVLKTGDSPPQLPINGFAEEMLVYCSLEEGYLMVTSLREVNQPKAPKCAICKLRFMSSVQSTVYTSLHTFTGCLLHQCLVGTPAYFIQ